MKAFAVQSEEMSKKMEQMMKQERGEKWFYYYIFCKNMMESLTKALRTEWKRYLWGCVLMRMVLIRMCNRAAKTWNKLGCSKCKNWTNSNSKTLSWLRGTLQFNYLHPKEISFSTNSLSYEYLSTRRNCNCCRVSKTKRKARQTSWCQRERRCTSATRCCWRFKS